VGMSAMAEAASASAIFWIIEILLDRSDGC
jgi:hypothetical protein